MSIQRTLLISAVICFLALQVNGWFLFGTKGSSTINNDLTINPLTFAKRLRQSLSPNILASMLTESILSYNTEYPEHGVPAPPCKCRCGEVNNHQSRIIGGSNARVNEYPWLARLSYFGRFYCGGSLINDRYVLSAAHCVHGKMWFMIKVRFGEHDRCTTASPPETRYVLRAMLRRFNVATYDSDIALLRLSDRVPINDIIRPICLPNRRATYAGTNATVAGWGATKESGSSSCILKSIQLPIISNLDCVQSTNYASRKITENMMCAGYMGGKKDACQGDSGGALMSPRADNRMDIAGVVSWGVGCGRAGFPGVFTRVSRFTNWIRQNTRDACYCRD